MRGNVCVLVCDLTKRLQCWIFLFP